MLENMIEPVIRLSTTRVPLRPRLALGPAGLLVLAVLFFTALMFVAVDAQASATDTLGGATDTPIGEVATNGDTTPEQPAPSSEPLPAAEATPPTTEQPPPVVASTGEESVPPVEQTPPATEQTTTTTETPPPATETPPPLPEVTPPPVTEAIPPPVEQAPPASETPALPPPVEKAPPVVVVETPPTVEQAPVAEEPVAVVDKKTAEQTAGAASAETDSNAVQGSGEGSQVSGSTHKDAPGEGAPGASAAMTAPAAPAVLSEISMPPPQDQPWLVFPAPPAVHDAGQAACGLAGLGASIAAGEARGLFGLSAVVSVSTVRLATVEASPSPTTVGGSIDGDGGSKVVHPFSPTPGPGSGGAGSGSAAGGGSGSASSAPFTLVGALLQAAPRAMRRLLLAQQSWRTSFLVLIPERPD